MNIKYNNINLNAKLTIDLNMFSTGHETFKKKCSSDTFHCRYIAHTDLICLSESLSIAYIHKLVAKKRHNGISVLDGDGAILCTL